MPMVRLKQPSLLSKFAMYHGPAGVGMHLNMISQWGFANPSILPWIKRYTLHMGYVNITIEWRDWRPSDGKYIVPNKRRDTRSKSNTIPSKVKRDNGVGINIPKELETNEPV